MYEKYWDEEEPSTDLIYVCQAHDNWFTVNEVTSCGCEKVDAQEVGRATPHELWRLDKVNNEIVALEDRLAQLYLMQKSLYGCI